MVDVFAVGLDLAMYHRWFLGAKTGTWQRLGGTFSSTVSAASMELGQLDVFARGADFTLRHRSLLGFTWSSDWQNLGGPLASPPVAVSWGTDRLDVFAVGNSGGLIHRWWDGQLWSDWEDLGGTLTATPAAVTWGPDRLDVFALGVDRAIWHYWWGNGAWAGRESFGGDFTSGPSAVSPAADRIQLVAPGSDGDMYTKSWDGGSWQPAGWQQVGAVKVALPGRYRFSVDQVHVTTTRSLDADTDAAQASVGAGNWAPQTTTQWIGDIGGLSTPKESQTNLLNFEPVTVELCEAVVFNYLVVNNGHADQKTIDTALVSAGKALTTDSTDSLGKSLGAGVGVIVGVEIAGTILAPVIGSLLGSLAGWLLDKLGGIVFADCDGLVAAEQLAMTGVELYLKTDGVPLTGTTSHPGTDSADGCGGNSQYEVTWTINRV